MTEYIITGLHKVKLSAIFSVAMGVLLTSTIDAQISELSYLRLSPLQTTEVKIGIIDVSLTYSRPSMRGRKIFGELEPYGAVWRTGANKNTKITFSDQVLIGGVKVAPGTYTLFTVPDSNSWDVYIHTELDEYGAPEKLDPSQIVAKVNVTPVDLSREVETLLISFGNLTSNAATLDIAWERTMVSMPIEVPTTPILDHFLSRDRKELSDNFSRSAFIWFDNEKDAEKALAAITQSILIEEGGIEFEEWLEIADLGDERLPDKYMLKSTILADLGMKEEAIAWAKKSITVNNRMKTSRFYDYYLKTNSDNIEKWSD